MFNSYIEIGAGEAIPSSFRTVSRRDRKHLHSPQMAGSSSFPPFGYALFQRLHILAWQHSTTSSIHIGLFWRTMRASLFTKPVVFFIVDCSIHLHYSSFLDDTLSFMANTKPTYWGRNIHWKKIKIKHCHF